MTEQNTIVNSGVKANRSPNYQYEYYFDSSAIAASGCAATLILFVVGTGMSCKDYADLSANCIAGQSTVMVIVDNNPEHLVKLSGSKTTVAFNDLVTNITARLDDPLVAVQADCKILVGGHSAGGSSVIDSMKRGKLTFTVDGFIGADPHGGCSFQTDAIAVPTVAAGFTVMTCAVPPYKAGLAAYNISPSDHRVMMQVINTKSGVFSHDQITHCIFTDDGCDGFICPGHKDGDWVRKILGDFVILFVESLNGQQVSKEDYENAVGTDHASKVNVFFDAETATLPSGGGVCCVS